MDDQDDLYPSKQQVVDRIPKRIKELQFGVLTNHEIVKQSVVEVSDFHQYEEVTVPGSKRVVTPHGPLDARLGTSSKTDPCQQCKEDLKLCNGHFGHVKLVLPAYHIGYFKKIIDTLSIICKDCSRVLLDEKTRRKYLNQVRRPDLDTLRKEAVCKKITEEAKKPKVCPYCSSVNGVIRKVPHNPVKLIHIKYQTYNVSNAKSKVKPESMVAFEASFDMVKKESPDLEKHIKRAVEDMDPLRALNLFRSMSSTDIELLGMNPLKGGPDMFLWQYVPTPPVAIRPSVAQENATTEDDITIKLGHIVEANMLLKAALRNGQPISQIIVLWEFLQVQLAMYIDGNLPGLGRDASAYGKPPRGFNQRLKGKQGRFRGNLSGKRVDFSGRTVISPDPNLSIEEVAVPSRVAKNMTYPERVTRYNHAKLRDCVRNGKHTHPGANFIIKKNGRKIVLEVLGKFGKLGTAADELEIGDVVERHLEDGDIVLFNRQPSLHKLSILSHKVKVRPWRTFRLNECVCNPYNADFDGDEMNLHVPQTEEARTEAISLMGVKHNLSTPKNGSPIISAIQDFITCAYLSSSKDLFFDRQTFTNVCSWMFNGDSVIDPDTAEHLPIELPPPTIVKPVALWTGKQLWNVLIRPNNKIKVVLNMEGQCKEYSKPAPGVPPDMNKDDAWLVIRNSKIMCGVMDKNTVGDGKKSSIFYVIMRDFGPDHAVASMNRLARLSARWLTNQGFSLGIGDVYPSNELTIRKSALIREAEDKCTHLIEQFHSGNLQRDAGCDEEQTMELNISGILSKVREAAGEACFTTMSRRVSPRVMAKCGSKGSTINVAQMIATVGQQIIGGSRVINGFQDRTLPHFKKGSREASAKGFVANSFFTGLSPTEFIFHAMSGREGLVDTAVKTAETGYMSRRLMKSLEDLSVQYDSTVRNSSSQVVQFQFGDDKLDPVNMEGDAKPVNFDRTFMHATTSTWNNDEKGLEPAEIVERTKEFLRPRREKLQRISLLGKDLDYGDEELANTDQLESARGFLSSVEDYVMHKASLITTLQGHVSKTNETTIHGRRVGGRDYAERVLKLSATTLDMFLALCLLKYDHSQVEAGHAVGAVGAQSIGEPGTQMTLKTFHFAGVAGMSITQGVPRIKEIINASKNISTPVITCELDSPYSEVAGRLVKALIEKTYLGDIVKYIEESWSPDGSFVAVKVDWGTVRKLGLQVNDALIQECIQRYKPFKALELRTRLYGNDLIRILVHNDGAGMSKTSSTSAKSKVKNRGGLFGVFQTLRRLLPKVVVKGYPDAQRAIIKKADKRDKTGRETVSVFVEGYGLKACMTTDGVDGRRTRSNSVMECKDVLGIEAARSTIICEIAAVMQGMDIDPRHMQLLADVMTFRGEVLGITRFGLAKMRDSVLQLASFEKTPDHLFSAASGMKSDKIEGVSECIIMGQSMSVGTGAMKAVRRLDIDESEVRRRKSAFEEAWAKTVGLNKKPGNKSGNHKRRKK